MSELRKDPILRRWVIVAPDRAKRPTNVPEPVYPEEPGFDPFLEGNESKTPPEIAAIRKPGSRANGPGWSLRVVPNKFPVLEVEKDLGKRGDGIYDCIYVGKSLPRGRNLIVDFHAEVFDAKPLGVVAENRGFAEEIAVPIQLADPELDFDAGHPLRDVETHAQLLPDTEVEVVDDRVFW